MVFNIYKKNKKNIHEYIRNIKIENSIKFQTCIKTISDELTFINLLDYGYKYIPRRDFKQYILVKTMRLINNLSKYESDQYLKSNQLNQHYDSVRSIEKKIDVEIFIKKINDLYNLLYLRND